MKTKIILCSVILLSAFSINGMNPFFEESAVVVQPKRQETLQEAYQRAMNEMAVSIMRQRSARENPPCEQPRRQETDQEGIVGCFSCFY
jgi:hypothetical protein